MPDENPNAVGIGAVVDAELKDISYRRGEDPAPPDPAKSWAQRCLEKHLFGIAISGGGIRSGTFALGILQGLAEKNLLQQADYISTVSGGGYIGSWLQGILKRGPQSYEPLLREVPQAAPKDPITFLRKYSNYLAPRLGLSLDVLVIPLIWFRNIVLNQAIIVSALAALFVLAIAPGALLQKLILEGDHCASLVSLTLCVLLTAIAVWKIGYNLRKTVSRELDGGASASGKTGDDEGDVRWWIALPLFSAMLLLVCALAPKDGVLQPGSGITIGFLLLWLLHGLLQWRGGFVGWYKKRRKTAGLEPRPLVAWFHVVWMSLLSGGLSVFLIHLVVVQSLTWTSMPGGSYHIVAWAPPLYFLSVVVGVGLQIGLMGKDFPDSGREWLVRVAAQLLIIAGVWAGLFAIAIFAPIIVARLWVAGRTYVVSSGGIAWILSTIMSVLAGKSSGSGNSAQQPSQAGGKTIDLLARFGPIIAIAGFLIAVALGVQYVLFLQLTQELAHYGGYFVRNYWNTLASVVYLPAAPIWLFVLATANFLILSFRVNINEFSMHQFYKNRLVRCYLGASGGTERKANAFTGFDPKDDLPMQELRRDAVINGALRTPYPIVNATLTVTVGSELATAERKALPWFFTPRFSGFFPAHFDRERDAQGKPAVANSYTPTAQMMDTGVPLGTAMAISGAAANPNMGFHTSPQTAFLLTLFNVRLGWWVGNPQNASTYRRSGPRVALWWLFRELLGFVDEKTAYLNLSDGGNFENLAMYELVRRRCRYLIVIDGEEDHDYQFGSLGGAVRKCRTDFGVEINIDPRAIQPQGAFSKEHCVVGQINYPEKDQKGQPETGTIFYMKASMTGDEPADVEEYRREFNRFPQQSTADQFFSESQFEAYRRLGLHVARTALDHLSDSKITPGNAFKRVKTEFESAPPTHEGVVTHHAEAYTRLMGVLAATDGLKALDPVLVKNFPAGESADENRRRAWFLCLDLIQLIENVFLDLDFSNANKWRHPGHAGWRTVIEYWAGKEVIQKVWETQRESYAKPFRQFFDDVVEEQKKLARKETPQTVPDSQLT